MRDITIGDIKRHERWQFRLRLTTYAKDTIDRGLFLELNVLRFTGKEQPYETRQYKGISFFAGVRNPVHVYWINGRVTDLLNMEYGAIPKWWYARPWRWILGMKNDYRDHFKGPARWVIKLLRARWPRKVWTQWKNPILYY